MSEEAIKIFYSYSRKDLEMRNRLESHLAALRAAGKIITWHDLELEAGTEWEPAILNKLDTANIILLLVSDNFINSKYCYGTELKRAIARHDAGQAKVIPILLDACDWNMPEVPFSKLNVLPNHAKPITKWRNRNEAFTNVAQQIRVTVDQLRANKLAESQTEDQQKQQRLAQIAAEQQAESERIQREQLPMSALGRLLQQEQGDKLGQLLQREQGDKLGQLLQREQGDKLGQLLQREQGDKLGQLLAQKEAEQRNQMSQTVSADDLASEKGVDYTRLRDLLKAGNWKAANYETYLIMLNVWGRRENDWIRPEEIEYFPCTDLRTIDNLWVEYSDGHFGFSVQKEIYLRVGGQLNSEYNEEIWESFGERVGWRRKGDWIQYSQIDFDTKRFYASEFQGTFDMSVQKKQLPYVPKGHIPSSGVFGVPIKEVKRGFKGWFSLFSRIEICNP